MFQSFLNNDICAGLDDGAREKALGMLEDGFSVRIGGCIAFPLLDVYYISLGDGTLAYAANIHDALDILHAHQPVYCHAEDVHYA